MDSVRGYLWHVGTTAEDYEAEIARLKARIAQLERSHQATLRTGSMMGAGAGPLTKMTIAGLEEMILVVSDEVKITYINQAMAQLLGLEDRKAAIGQPLAEYDQGPLGEGTLRGLFEIVRPGTPYALEKVCPGLPLDRVQSLRGNRPAGDPVVRLVAEPTKGRVQIIVQDVTRLRWLEETFARYVPSDVIQDLERMPTDEHLRMVRKDLTILFGDLRGFTRVSQGLPPDGVQELVNAFMAFMGDGLDDLGGTAVSWMGDGVMAVFGAPLYTPDHPVRGLVAAVELQRRHERWKTEREARSLPAPQLGLGVMTGEVVVGNVGSDSRLCYTALGHTTNMSARLCGRAEGGQTLTTPKTHRAAMAALESYSGSVPIPRLSFASVGKMSFRNVAEPVDVVQVRVKSA